MFFVCYRSASANSSSAAFSLENDVSVGQYSEKEREKLIYRHLFVVCFLLSVVCLSRSSSTLYASQGHRLSPMFLFVTPSIVRVESEKTNYNKQVKNDFGEENERDGE